LTLVNSSRASAICGTALGLTKLVTSTTDSPESASISMSTRLVVVSTSCFSFCSPSRGPTSTILTRCGTLFSQWFGSCRNLLILMRVPSGVVPGFPVDSLRAGE
jgi:hypothetical protein